MKLKKIFLFSLGFLFVLSMGIVSASEDIASEDLSLALNDLSNQDYLIIDADASIQSDVNEDDNSIISNEIGVDSYEMSNETVVDSPAASNENEGGSSEMDLISNEPISNQETSSLDDDSEQSKLNSFIIPIKNSIVKGNYFYAYLKDANGNAIANEKLVFTVKGKTYNALTDNNGKAGFKVDLAIGKYSLKINYDGNDNHSSVSKTIDLFVPSTTQIVIGNERLLTKGYLRIYLKSATKSAISKKLVHISVNGKKFDKTTNSEGIIVFKPLAATGTLAISVTFDGDSNAAPSSAKKSVKGIEGSAKSPFYNKIPLRNGAPDIDLMPRNYVLADGTGTYTLTKAQYLAVIKRDSYCLFLNNKLSKYTFFKTKNEPSLFHIIPRKKWNVIERAVNTKVVKKNKHGFWPSQITVSLNGKSYTYSEVRDVQDLTYSCGPTSASMCTQVLRNYYCEKYLVKLSSARKGYGSSPTGLSKALKKHHYKCTEYFKSSINKAFKELKKGGCALIFHVAGHYISILDISKNGKKVLVSNSRGGYNRNAENIPTKWLTAKYMKKKFANDTPGLIVRLNYSLSKKTKNRVNNFYSSMGTKWTRQNTSERIPQI